MYEPPAGWNTGAAAGAIGIMPLTALLTAVCDVDELIEVSPIFTLCVNPFAWISCCAEAFLRLFKNDVSISVAFSIWSMAMMFLVDSFTLVEARTADTACTALAICVILDGPPAIFSAAASKSVFMPV